MTAGDLVVVVGHAGRPVILAAARPFGFDEKCEGTFIDPGTLALLLTDDEEMCRILIDGQRMHVSRTFLRLAS